MPIEKLFAKARRARKRTVPARAGKLYDSLSLPSGRENRWRGFDARKWFSKDYSSIDFAFAPKVIEATACEVSTSKTARASWSPSDKLEAAIAAFGKPLFCARVPPRKNAVARVSYSPKSSALGTSIIEVGDGATLDLYEDFCGAPRSFFGIKEIFVIGKNAKLNCHSLQDFSASAFFFASKEFRAGSGSRADSFHAELGAGLSRLCIANRSDSANSAASHRAAYLGTADRSFDCFVASGHEARTTKCSFLVKSALFGDSSSTVRGEIWVGNRAAKADASFADRALHLSRDARSQSIPMLFIGNDAVKASHSSSKAGLDEDELFYLQARGLSRPVAAKLAVTGFLCEPLNEANAEWSGRVRALVQKRAVSSKNEVLE